MTDHENQIRTLIENPESFENPVERLGVLCGQLAVSQESSPKEVDKWSPQKGDWDALEELLDVESGKDRFNDHEQDVLFFVDSFKKGVKEAIKGKQEIQNACDELEELNE